jgi:hypothetical protein
VGVARSRPRFAIQFGFRLAAMSGLWTPDGERPTPSADEGIDEFSPDLDAIPEPVSDDEKELIAELAMAEQQLLATPVSDVIANHCYGLFQLGALHLGQQPPNLDESRTAIDALGAIVDVLGERLGENAETLREGLGQIRLAYVQIAGALGGAMMTDDTAADPD